MDKKIFIKTGTVVRQNDANIIIHNTLPVGVYEVQKSMDGLFLNQIGVLKKEVQGFTLV